MKKIEIDFLKQSQKELQNSMSFDEIKDKIHIEQNQERKQWGGKKIWGYSIVLVLIVITIGLSIHTIQVEAEEYQQAIAFFQNYQLKSDGLTKAEMKRVYRDVTTNAFQYEKTGEVILESIQSNVLGYEISTEQVTSGYLKSVWAYWNQIHETNQNQQKGTHYEIKGEYKKQANGQINMDQCVFTKWIDDEELWHVQLKQFYVTHYQIYPDCIILYGDNILFKSSTEKTDSYVVVLNHAGELLWEKKFAETTNIYAVFYHTDDTYVVMSEENYQSNVLNYTKLDVKGNTILSRTHSLSSVQRIGKIVRLEHDFLVYIQHSDGTYQLMKMNDDGEKMVGYHYENDDQCYFFTDMLDYHGQLYLSGYAIPKPQNDISNRSEIADIIYYIHEQKNDIISDEALTILLKAHYQAVLLICNEETGELQTFYAQNGALGGQLSRSELGYLIWDVETIDITTYSPATSSFTLGGINKIVEYVFAEDGNCIGKNHTDERIIFRR
ncbi:MAG: hypothetical protein NC182_04205 [Prevotella sp.]|nr:hypothetical protein [Staphylococcus sp.]MCM1350384.1 hypothetical protein [Prevotella sp.]